MSSGEHRRTSKSKIQNPTSNVQPSTSNNHTACHLSPTPSIIDSYNQKPTLSNEQVPVPAGEQAAVPANDRIPVPAGYQAPVPAGD
ncbi:hypothetical protein EJ06DRAFT_287818 [Trichodelitschia bisporula]|uniref:Uncharacterized protein n=1 Tax=Trichodelitschia bisporula TaxID=703511 RepID=A0A6G1I6K5_9PEZI|nr:hypothetical protein EJ06DRAFT_287818 [Trichodelitschia bisporula]